MDRGFQGNRSMMAGGIGNSKRGSKAHEPEMPIIPMTEAWKIAGKTVLGSLKHHLIRLQYMRYHTKPA